MVSSITNRAASTCSFGQVTSQSGKPVAKAASPAANFGLCGVAQAGAAKGDIHQGAYQSP